MNAKILYRIEKMLHPWSHAGHERGMECWCIVKVTKPEYGNVVVEPVAMFNLDSEAETFQAHVLSTGLDEKLISIDPELKQLLVRGIK
jgi:hypothetical protein